MTLPVLPAEWWWLQLELEGRHVWRLLTQVQWVMHGMRMGVRVGRVRWMRVVMGGVSQRWMVVPLSSPLSSPHCRCSFCSLASLSGQTSLVCGGPMGLRDNDVGVLEESSGAEAVVVHRLGVGLQVTLHVLWVEGEVGA